jgi:hypothetical protein
MDTSGDPGNLAYGSAGALVRDQRWISGDRDTLRFTLKSVEVDSECFVALGDHLTTGDTLKSEGGIALDGNLNPEYTDGVGPNGDAFAIPCECQYKDPNYAASLGLRWAYQEGHEVVVGWQAEAEWETKAYVVEAAGDAHWTEVGRVARSSAAAPKTYSLRVEGTYDLYRIVEIDRKGKRSLFRPIRVRDSAPAFLAELLSGPVEADWCEQVDRTCSSSGIVSDSGRLPTAGPLSPEVPDWVFYGPDSLLAECGPAVSWFESKGHSVDLAYAASSYH